MRISDWSSDVCSSDLPEGTANPELASGEIEVLCKEVEILDASITPPFQLDDDNLSETTRLTHRVLDLRRPQMQRNLMLRYRVSIEVRKFLDQLGFIDIETPMLTKSTPEGATDIQVPSRVNAGHFFALQQSPQLFKQMLLVSGRSEKRRVRHGSVCTRRYRWVID